MDYLFNTSIIKPVYSVQKFHRLLIEGIAAKGYDITILSSIPISRTKHKKIWWNNSFEIHGDVKYIFLPFINFRFIRQFFVAFFSFIHSLWWCLHSKRGSSVIICDVLNVAVTAASLVAGKICGIKTCAIVTDIPVMSGKAKKKDRKSLLEKWAIAISSFLMISYDNYVLLTEQMNEIVNPHNKPYMVMEGLVDINMGKTQNTLNNKALERILIYAGGIYEKYGIKKLLEAFMRLEGDDLRLHIYGSGEMENDMPYFMYLDKRIVYHGVVPNKIVVEKQIEATLLINPRHGNQEFTKYSFPSKNMEYMASGTPVITTPLPGMPKEYYDYVYFFKDETVDGFIKSLNNIVNLPSAELVEKGQKAKAFALEKKII